MVLAIRNSIELASIVGRVDHLIDEAMLVLKDLTSKIKELDRRVAELSQEEHLDEFLIFFESELERFELATRICKPPSTSPFVESSLASYFRRKDVNIS